MRYATLVLAAACLLFAGCVTTASQMEPAGPAVEPMEAANRILIRTQDDPETAYRTIARILQREGYSLGNTDETLMTVTTDWKNYQGAGGEMRVTAYVDKEEQQATLTLQGKHLVRIGGGAFGESAGTTIQNIGQEGSPAEQSFDELERLASLYEGGEVMYARN